MTHPALAKDNIAVVTGAGHGIGLEICREFVARDMRVVMLDVDAAKLRAAREEVGGTTMGQRCDVSIYDSIEIVRERILEEWGSEPSVLVNNAVTRMGAGMWAPVDKWRQSMDVNVFGIVNGVHAFGRGMIESGQPGLIVNVGSKQALSNAPGHPIYNMSKAAVHIYTEALEHELRQKANRGVTAHLLIPGWTTMDDGIEPREACTPRQVVEKLMQGIAAGKFYILCQDGEMSEKMEFARILWGAEDLTEGRPPLSRWHPDWQDEFERRQAG